MPGLRFRVQTAPSVGKRAHVARGFAFVLDCRSNINYGTLYADVDGHQGRIFFSLCLWLDRVVIFVLFCFITLVALPSQHKQRNLVWTKGTDALEGELQSSSEVDFYIDQVNHH